MLLKRLAIICEVSRTNLPIKDRRKKLLLLQVVHQQLLRESSSRALTPILTLTKVFLFLTFSLTFSNAVGFDYIWAANNN
jgi:hypothetical protein